MYHFRVYAFNSLGSSMPADAVAVTTLALPVAPSALTATAILASQIKLSWTDNAADETGYRIERKAADSTLWVGVTTVKADVVSYTNIGLSAEKEYAYRVRAVRGTDYSLYSNEASATTLTLPAAPGALTATAILASQIKLSWTDNAADETGYRIERKTGAGGTWVALTTVKADVTTYTNGGLSAEGTYYYRVRTVRSVDYSLYSNEAQGLTMPLPVAPSGLTASGVTKSSMKLSWLDNAADETGYRIERKAGQAGSWAYIGSAAANSTTYTNTGLAANSAYSYRVRAYRGTDTSAYSNESMGVTLP
jgi:fibronectin type 3 domain-containing protein